MRRGIFFSLLLATLALGGVLLVASRADADAAAVQTAADLMAARKLHLAFADISEDVSPITDIVVDQNADVLSIFDHLPARKDVAGSLRGYDRFVKEYYQTPELRVTFLSAGGQEINLSGLNPSLQILPFGLNYSYPQQEKRELETRIAPQEFSNIRGIVLNITLVDAWFNPLPPVTCAPWDPYKACTAGTTHCLKLVLLITDKNGTVYASTCAFFDADKDSDLKINLANETSTDKWIRVHVGDLPELYAVRLQKSAIDIQSSFVFTSSDYYLNLIGQLRVTDLPSNASRQDRLSSGAQQQVANGTLIKQLLGLT